MIDWIMAESGGHVFFFAFPWVMLLLFIMMRGRRVRFLIPSVILTVAVINPWFYKWWENLAIYAYWRILWIVPVIPFVAAFVSLFSENAEMIVNKERRISGAAKPVIAVVGIAGIILGGSFMYNAARGQFSGESVNRSKLPESSVQIADRLLELDEHPRVVFQYPLGTYIRQYTSEIDQLFGRDIDGYILSASNDARTVNGQLNNSESDWYAVATIMANDSYEYLVVVDKSKQERLAEAGFELIDHIDEYGIYRGHGIPTVVKDRNEFGQVTTITTVNEAGVPINGESGYAKISYEYDQNGNIIREFRTDVEGNGVADSDGRAGYEREFDSNAHIILERIIGPDGAAVANNAGYALVKRKYKGSNLIQESYYDINEQPVNHLNTCYALVQMNYDGEKNRISEKYFDKFGNTVISSYGYAEVRRKYNERRLAEEKYYDQDGSLVSIATGYAGKTRLYDSMGNMIKETYYDEKWKPVNCINGYASVEREYDEKKNIILQRYLDVDNNPVITGAGFAEVHRYYEGKQMIREEYYGPDGMPYTQPAGHVAIEQTWNGDALGSRTYYGASGIAINRVDGYSKMVLEQGATCTNVKFYDTSGTEVLITDLNLARDIRYDSEGWSDWIVPAYNVANSCQYIGYVSLDEKKEGDVYIQQIEIEFKGAASTEGQPFGFRTQGAQDGKWFTGNVWDRSLIDINEAPEDGVYIFTSTRTLSGTMLNISIFDIGFRCDYWSSGMYRVRNVKIEKGSMPSEWSPGI